MRFRNVWLAGILTVGIIGVVGSAAAENVRLFVRHEVADYAAWRKVFDGFAATQKKFGVYSKAVYRSTDDPNDITVTDDFHSLEKAKAFSASAELKAAMEMAGVKGAPQIWYTTRAVK